MYLTDVGLKIVLVVERGLEARGYEPERLKFPASGLDPAPIKKCLVFLLT
jgi:hypothetical protein